MKASRTLIITAFLSCILLGALALFFVFGKNPDGGRAASLPVIRPSPAPEATPAPAVIPRTKILETSYHIFQTRNNCAPAALSMALSYYGITASQETLADALRPYQSQTGDDDKSTPPDELAGKAKEYGLIPYFRANGRIETVQRLIANDMPVVVRALLEPDKDYAHYRVIKGYDDETGEFIQDDSLQGKDLRYTYDDFIALWRPFNYGYLVLAPPEKRGIIEAILGPETDPAVAWQGARETAERELEQDPDDVQARFNLSVASFSIGDYTRSVREFEAVESDLPMRTLWYQIEPIQAYFELGNYERVFALTDRIFRDGNPAFAELHLLRGQSRIAQGEAAKAREEFEKAVLYNQSLASARQALDALE